MRIEHVAVWTKNLERLEIFYETYFQAEASAKYVNPDKQFESYFLTFPSGGARLELMQIPTLQESSAGTYVQSEGYAHLAFSVGSEEQVNALTARLEKDGFLLVDGPRHTGDGYYESCILDPDGNRVEITT
jgi:lactoylglutathione lyase